MKKQEIKFIPRQDKIQKKIKTDDSKKSNNPEESKESQSSESSPKLTAKEQMIEDLTNFVKAIVVATGVYFIAVALMSDMMSYFLKHLLGLILGLMFLAAYRVVQKTPPVIGKAVLICLLIIFIYNTSNHYFVSSGEQSHQTGQVISRKEQPADSVVALRPGRYSIKLESGATTKWMKLPYGQGLINYSISSPTYNYQFIIAGKKKVYKGGKDADVPLEVGLPFQIQALEDETITIVITRV